MLNVYDQCLKKHIESFLSVGRGKHKIPVFGLQNEDELGDSVYTQAGAKTDKVGFPMVTIIRLPQILITDQAMTKRPANYAGYFLQETDIGVHLNVMRCDLSYAIDTYATNKKETEDLSIQLYHRLRNNPQLTVDILLPIKNKDGLVENARCVCDIVMSPEIVHLKIQGTETPQVYRLRSQFFLKNVNLYDISAKEFVSLEYVITAQLKR